MAKDLDDLIDGLGAYGGADYGQALATAYLAREVGRVADSIHRLGTAEAQTPFGAIEALSMAIADAADNVGIAIASLKGE